MGFSHFKTEREVAKRFNLKTDSKPFVKTLPLKNIPDYKFEEIKENFKDPLNEAQLLNDLKATQIEIGLLVNFTHPKAVIKRLVY